MNMTNRLRKQTLPGSIITGTAILALACTLGATGCAGTSVTQLEYLELSHEVQYNDIPVPFGFEFDNRESWAYRKFEESAMPFRSCELVYYGDRPLRHLANWYESQMPVHDWTHERTTEDNVIHLVFSKGIEATEIELRRTLDRDGREPVTQVKCKITAR